ncbi:MAG: hypothetical protein JEZ05_03465 [Tenericutes bacterium]|nr:hypothetical protein [Mycoplasmatota bacterium]
MEKNKIKNFIVTRQQWIGFVILIAALFYAYITVLFESEEIALDIIYAILFVFLIVGLVRQFIRESDESKKIRFNDLDALFVIIAVFFTYSLSHFLGISVVLASSMTGLLGYFLVKKHQLAVYCGSFAGMVSVSLFGFLEVSVLALVCAFIFILTKPLFKGYGGKLGTVAFLSSLIVHSIFADDFITVSISFNTFLLILTTILGVLITFYFKHFFKVSAVFASALPSFIFALIFICFIPEHYDYVVVYFSASFIGMSSEKRLKNVYYVLLSGIVLGLIYDLFIEFFNGLGGKLGLMAMISVIITSGISMLLDKMKKRRRGKVYE